MTSLDSCIEEKENRNTRQASSTDILINQEDALSVYLQSLLGGAALGDELFTDTEKDAVDSVADIRSCKKVGKAEEPLVQIKAEVEKAESDALAPGAAVAEVPKREFLVPDSGIPVWVNEDITCLSARIGGLTILIPAEYIECIQNVTGRLASSAKMPVWVYELVDDEEEPIQIVNTRKLVFGGVKSHHILPDSRSYAILLDDGAWGLSCDAIGDVVKLKKEDIRWRGKTGKRRWLAGTVSDHNAVILDVNKIEKALLR